jgi:hypothetical protein
MARTRRYQRRTRVRKPRPARPSCCGRSGASRSRPRAWSTSTSRARTSRCSRARASPSARSAGYTPGRRRAHDRLERHRAHRRAAHQAVHRGARADGHARWSTCPPASTSAPATWTSATSSPGWPRPSRSRRSATTTSVGLIGFTDQVEVFVPPRSGRKHVLAVVQQLLTHEARRAAAPVPRPASSTWPASRAATAWRSSSPTSSTCCPTSPRPGARRRARLRGRPGLRARDQGRPSPPRPDPHPRRGPGRARAARARSRRASRTSSSSASAASSSST